MKDSNTIAADQYSDRLPTDSEEAMINKLDEQEAFQTLLSNRGNIFWDALSESVDDDELRRLICRAINYRNTSLENERLNELGRYVSTAVFDKVLEWEANK